LIAARDLTTVSSHPSFVVPLDQAERMGPGNFIILMGALVLASSLAGCAVVAVADAAVTVVATAVSAGATVIGTTVDVAAAGVSAVTPGGSPKK